MISILREAVALAEHLEDRKRLHTCAVIARTMEKLSVEAEFGSYVDDALGAYEKWSADSHPQRAERMEQFKRRQELDADAKRRLLSGDFAGAQAVYMFAEDLRDDHEQRGVHGAHETFLNWKLEAGDLSGALDLFKLTDWGHPWTRVYLAREIASAFITAGQRSQGLLILEQLRPAPDSGEAYETLCYLGQAFWLLGETREGKVLLREAAKASLAAAARNIQLPLFGYLGGQPISIARIQCAISDREGAVATLKGTMALAVPLEYEPPEPPKPPPADLPPGTVHIHISGPPRPKPAAKRWFDARLELVGMLARAGLYTDAFSFLTAPNAKQLETLVHILRGQAESGDFSESFNTLTQMQNQSLTTEAEPTNVILSPTGEISVHKQASPIRPINNSERSKALKQGLSLIMNHAARLGEVDAFRRARSQWCQAGLDDDQITWRDCFELRNLAKAGHVDVALEFAQQVPDPHGRVAALLAVVEGIARVPDRWENPFFP